MKTTKCLWLTTIMAAFGCITGNAEVIYFNDFTLGGTGTLEGTAPTVAYTDAGGSSSALWNLTAASTDNSSILDNGDTGASADSANLAFTPESGYLYTLTASVTVNAGINDWVGIGFMGGSIENATSTLTPSQSRMGNKAAGGGYDWLIIDGPNSAVQYWAGKDTANPFYTDDNSPYLTGAGTYTIEVQLDTADTTWTAAGYINGDEIGSGSVAYTTDTITSAGLTDYDTGGAGTAVFNSFELTAVPVPEPSTMALATLGMGAFSLFYRKQKSGNKNSLHSTLT